MGDGNGRNGSGLFRLCKSPIAFNFKVGFPSDSDIYAEGSSSS